MQNKNGLPAMSADRQAQAGKKSVENLHHFSCGKCGKWWSIGDAPIDKHNWFCPWCGEKQNIK